MAKEWIGFDRDRGVMTTQPDEHSVARWLAEFTGGKVQNRRHYDCDAFEYFIGPRPDDWDNYLVLPKAEASGYAIDIDYVADLTGGRWTPAQRWYVYADEFGVELIRNSQQEALEYLRAQWGISTNPTRGEVLLNGDHCTVKDPNGREVKFRLFRGDQIPQGVDLTKRALYGFL